MAENILVSPLGRSPGAVSGVLFALNEDRYNISRVITVGTGHKDVRTAARRLTNLFDSEDIIYEPIHIATEELRNLDGSAATFVASFGEVLESANQGLNKVHVSVTGGRAGMGALAALATNLYGTDHLWHLWVTDKIAQGGEVSNLPLPYTRDNLFLNPTLEEGAYELVELPFIDMRPLHPLIWKYYQSGEQEYPDPDSPYYGLFASGQIKQLRHVFPAGLTIGQTDRIMEMAEEYPTLAPAEQLKRVMELAVIMDRANIVDDATQNRLRLMVIADEPVENILRAIADMTDKPGLATLIKEWLDKNQGRLSLGLSFFSAVAEILSLYVASKAGIR